MLKYAGDAVARTWHRPSSLLYRFPYSRGPPVHSVASPIVGMSHTITLYMCVVRAVEAPQETSIREEMELIDSKVIPSQKHLGLCAILK